MKIVIELDEYDIEWIHNAYDIPNEIKSKIVDAIENGTPLPKNHGDLIDKDVLRNNIHYVPIAPIFQDDYVTYRNVIFADILDMLPTIIEEVKADE